MRKKVIDILVIGLALFSMFFGAGNTVFPPYLGMGAGDQWITALFGYFIADIGFALVAIFAILRYDGDAEAVTGRIGKIPGTLIMSAAVICLCPLLVVPRTAATTFEMSVAPFTDGGGKILCSIIYFAVIFALTIRESSVIDIVGKYLTPALFIGLLVLIVKGIVTPIGPISDMAKVDNVVVSSINSGYQTMDVLASLVYGLIILKTVCHKGYSSLPDQAKIIGWSGIVASVGLMAVYCGLTYLGATTSTLYGMDINLSQLIMNIIRHLLGESGLFVLGIIVALACITSAIGLVSSGAHYFSKVSGGKISYGALIVVFCVLSTVIANFGLEKIVHIAAPILSFVFPGILTLIFLSFLSPRRVNVNICRGATAGAMATGLVEILHSWGAPVSFVTRLPLANLGFSWVTPAIACGVICAFLPNSKQHVRSVRLYLKDLIWK
jgi:LIVCS family branched-chain amino acid:cation transporter